MPKSRSKIKKSIITSAAAIIGLTEEFESSLCCSKRKHFYMILFSTYFLLGNCPSYWHDRLTEKLKILQQSKLKPPLSSSLPLPSKSTKRCHKLSHSNILSKLFLMNNNNKLIEKEDEIYSAPVPKSIVLEKHEAFANQISKTFQTLDDLPYCFTKTNLKSQMQYRMISLVADPFSDQVFLSLFLKL
jgi:hypothetical protein